ncbi:BTAD domain-containing putative transcriptional regulator [uncultured Williamsia sp.]|uniref:ATP-binding protein n=1 Tax=uncultured Williamsia sp. TaxID=259311 RepID=UPI00262DB31A|nr:BTAD domain-containing putative transcriptional regulator [uncultured Williamsia sp.]
MTIVTIGLLGPVAVDTGDGMQTVPGARARRLLAALAVEPGALRSSRALIETVWDDAPPQSPQAALHTQVSRLRQALPDGALLAEPSGYRLLADAVTTDLARADDLLDAGTPAALDEAIGMWRGTPGDDLAGPLADAVRSRADDLRRRIDFRRAQVALDDSDADTARRLAAALCAADPLDEPAHLLHMQALAAAGRTGDALAVFARIRRALSAELGADPGAELDELHRILLRSSGPVPTAAPAPPPLRQARAVGLRAEPNPLLGRDDEMDDIVTALGSSRVVTVTGPGGAGKTRVAQAVARTVHSAGRDVFVVELASVRSDEDVVAAIAGGVGVGENDVVATNRGRLPVGDLATRVADALGGRSVLLVLDNCEQIVDGAARAVADLIAAAADVTVLATSRSPLMIAGEVTHRLRPLAIEETTATSSPAVDLFVARATAVRPDVTIDRARIADLCARLDGLPLAIELAAARARSMSVADIADLLTRRLTTGRLAVFRTGDRTAPQRHRTLEAVIGWSWDLLDDDARSLMRTMCRFPSGFTADAAHAVMGDVTGADSVLVDDALEALVAQSLVGVDEADGQTRYRMLEMVREFGDERLSETGDALRVDAAMVRWAERFAGDTRELFDSGDNRCAAAGVTAESGNLVWILRRCVDDDPDARPDGAVDGLLAIFPVLAASWVARGLHAEVRAFAPRVVANPPPPGLDDEATREKWLAALLMATGHLLMIRPDLRAVARGMTALRAAHRPSETLTRPADFAAALMLSRRRYAGLRLITRGVRADDPEVRTIALSLRSNVAENLADLDRALQDSLAAQALAASRGNSWILAMGSTEIAGIHGQSGRYAEAATVYRASVAGLEDLGALDESRQVRCYLVATLAGLGRIDEAAAEFDTVSGGWKPGDPIPTGSPETVGLMLVVAAELAWQRGEPETAAELGLAVARFVVGEHLLSSDPSYLLTLSAAIALAATCGRPAEALVFAGALAGMVGGHHPGGVADLPQYGAAAIAVGAARCARQAGDPVGRRLLAHGIRIGGRRDHPVLLRIVDDPATAAGVDASTWDATLADATRMPRRDTGRDILALLQER